MAAGKGRSFRWLRKEGFGGTGKKNLEKELRGFAEKKIGERKNKKVFGQIERG